MGCTTAFKTKRRETSSRITDPWPLHRSPAPGQLVTLNFAPMLSSAATRALVAIKLIESPLTNDLRQFQKIAGGAPLAMVAVAIDRISPDLGSLGHY